MALTVPLYTEDQTYPAQLLRKQMQSVSGWGIVNDGDFAVTAVGMNVSVAPGSAYVAQTVQTEGAAYNGLYFVINDAAANPFNTISAPISNPRVDSVILRVYDVNEQGLGGSSKAQIEWLPGSETASATLANQLGMAPYPPNVLLLAQVLQTVGQTSINPSNLINYQQYTNASPATVRKTVMTSAGILNPLAPGGWNASLPGSNYFLTPGGAFSGSQGFSTGPPVWFGDTLNEWLIPGKTARARVRMTLIVNSVTPVFNISGALMTTTGGGGSNTMLLGNPAIVSGSQTPYVGNPTAQNMYNAESAEFNLPTGGAYYVLGVNVTGGTGAMAPSSNVLCTLQLLAYNS